MTYPKEVLKQHAAESIDAAFEAGYDAAAEVAYTSGFEDGIDRGRREVLDHIEAQAHFFSTNQPVELPADDSDPGDACDCPDCAEEDESPCDCDLCRLEAVEAEVTGLGDELDYWAPSVDALIKSLSDCVWKLSTAGIVLAAQVAELEEAADLAEADAVVLEALNERVAALEDAAQAA